MTSTGALGADLVILAQADTGTADPAASDGFVVEPAKEGDFDPSNITQTFTSTEGGTVTLPSGTSIERILISGEDLLIIAADGSVFLIQNGALNVPSISIDGFTIPSGALAEAVNGAPEIEPAAGPESGSGQPGSSGNSFSTPEGSIADGFETVDLLGFTEFETASTEFEDRDPPLDEDTAPIFLGADTVTVEEDDLNQGLGIKYHYLSKKYAKSFWDQIESGDKDGDSVGNNEDGSIDAFTATGNLNIDFQDDGQAAVDPLVFTPGQDAPEGLTSDGQQIVYSISADGLTLTASDEDGVVFTVVLDPTVPGGQYTFTLIDNIDHLPTELGEELLNLGFSVTATDGDGSATVGEFDVNIQDDVPILLTKEMIEEPNENQSENESPRFESEGDYDGQGYGDEQIMLRMGMVDEDDLNNFDPDHNSDGDNVEGSHGTDGSADGAVKAYGSLGVLFGADDGEARSIVFNLGSDAGSAPETDAISRDDREGESGTELTAYVKGQDGYDVEVPLTSKGEEVEYVLSEDGTTLLAFAGGIPEDPFGEDGGENEKYSGQGGSGGPRLVFKVTLDDDDYGYFKFTLFDQLDHPKTDDPNTEETETAFEDTLVLKFGFTATDSDGDSIDSELTIKVKDDVPELNCPPKDHDYEDWDVVGENLIVNGGFEQFNGELNQTNGDGSKWGKFDDSDVPGWKLGDSGNPIEIQKDVYDNDSPNSEGEHELELDSDGNSTVYQEVPTHDCGYFKLSFDYSPRPGSDEETNPVEVWWNGELLTTITGNGEGLDGFVWETYTFLVEGNGDTGKLEFRGAGDNDSFGGMIDSVSLYEVQNPYQVQGFVDEDDLHTLLSHGTSPDGDTGWLGTVSTRGELNTLVKGGADEEISFSFTDNAVATLEAQNLTSKGESLSYHVIDGPKGSLILAVDDNGDKGIDRPVFALKLTNDGEFKFILADQLDHDIPGIGNLGEGAVEDILKIDFSEIVQVTDFDGDTVVLKDDSFVIKVKDDVPETTGEKVVGHVDEDDLDTPLSQGTDADNNFFTIRPISAAGSLKPLVKVGADEVNHGSEPKGEFSFQDDAVDTMKDQGLKSKGQDLSFKIVGDTLIGFVDRGEGKLDRPVFKLELQENGEFKYVQFDQLDHELTDNPHTQEVETSFEDKLEIDFSKIVEFSDFDGDTIALDHDSFVIKVKDDVPETTGKQVVGHVDEDNLDTPLSQGTDADHDPHTFSPISTKGSLNKLVKVGADEVDQSGFLGKDKKGEFNFQDDAVDTMKEQGLKSKGQDLSFKIVGDTLIGFVDGGEGKDDRTVFELELQENGKFEYVQYDQLDHELTDNPYTQEVETSFEDKLEIDFSKIVEFSDFDGDTIELDHDSFVIKVKDDVPETTGEKVVGHVDEDNLDTPLSQGTDADNNFFTIRPISAAGSLKPLVKVGADEVNHGSEPKGEFSFQDDAVDTMKDQGLKSKGQDLSFKIVGDTLIGFVDRGEGKLDRPVFKLELQDNGEFKYVQFDQLDHELTDNPHTQEVETSFEDKLEIDFSKIVEFSDFDGDTIELDHDSFVIKVKDDVPETTGKQVVGHVDEDNLDTPLSQGTDADHDPHTFSPISTKGSLNKLVKVGADEVDQSGFLGKDKKGEFNFQDDAVDTMKEQGLKSKGQDLSFKIVGDTLIGFVDGGEGKDDRTVFELELQENGKFEYVQYDQLDHELTDNPYTQAVETSFEDKLEIDFSKIVEFSDFDGDTIALDHDSFVIKVKDDVPETTGKSVIGHVDEDDLDTPLSQGTDADHYYSTYSPISTSGTLKSLVKVGADEVNHGSEPKGEFSFQDDAVDTMKDQGLKSKGQDLSFEIVGDTLIGFVDGKYDRPVFKLELQDNGEFKYVQYDQLDHELTDNPYTQAVETSFEDKLEIDFSKIVEFSDFDGDTIALDHDSFVIKVKDDVPETTGKSVVGHVDEDNLDTSLSQGTDAHHHGNNGPISTSGWLNQLVRVGADEVNHGKYKTGEFDFQGDAVDTMKEQGLTSKGQDLSFKIVGDTLIGFVDGGESADRPVFKLELQDSGYFKYVQFDQLDHKNEYGKPIDKLEIDFSKIVEFSDFDGDTIALDHDSFVIKVIDDNPIVFSNQHKIVVDEDGLPDGNPRGPGDEGVQSPQNQDSGKLKFKVGADEPADIDFADMDGDPVKDKHGNDIKSDGAELIYVWDQDTHTLSAKTVGGDASGTTIFTMQVTNVATGAYVFKLEGPVDHPNPHLEDDINLKLDFNVTDYDHDTASGSVHVLIDDDSPVIKSIEDIEITAPYDEPVVKMGDIDVRFGGDGPGALKLKDVDFEGYETELSDDGTKLTGTQNGVKIFEVSIDQAAEKYTYKLFETPSGVTETTEVDFTDVDLGWRHTAETITTDGVTFNGKLFKGIGNAFDVFGSKDNLNPHDDNGFGIKDEFINDQSHGHKKEGFQAEFNEGPVKSFSFDIEFGQKTPSVEISYKLFKDGVQVGSTETETVLKGSGSEVPFSIEPGASFDEVLIMFDLPPDAKKWDGHRPEVQLNDFEYTREAPPQTEFEFEVVATDNDGDKTVGDFTVEIEPTKSLTLKILQENHSGGEADQHYFDDLKIEVDGVEVSYTLVNSENATLNGDDLLLSGGAQNADRVAYIQIDNVPLDGELEVSTTYSNGDGARDIGSAEAGDNQEKGEGVRILLDAGDGFVELGDYRTDPRYTADNVAGQDTEVPRSFGANYAADGSISVVNDPIVIDLNGDGASLLSAADGVSFDLDADGTADQTGWVAPEDGLLVVDVDGSGSIEDGMEVFSENFNGGDFDNSLEALASLDDNGDGVIDADDAAFEDILVWQDANSDGVSQSGELQSLADHGITSIDLGAEAADRDVNGNHIFAEGQITLESGEVGTYVGVDLAGASLPSEGDLRQQRQIAAADAIAAAIGAVAIIDLVIDTADAATASVSTEPEHGDVTVNADLSVTYEGSDGFTGSDSFVVEFVNSSGTPEFRTVQLDVEDGVVTASAVSAPGDTVLLGTEGNDTLETGGGAAPVADGETVADGVLVGGEGDDVLIGGEGDDVLTGGEGDDELHGGAGDDTLFGGAGDDELFGDDGEDILIGGAGANELTGGGDADVFVFTKEALGDGLLDQILDYNFAEGDTVDLSQLFDVDGGDLSDFVEYDAATGELKVDVDGAGGAEAQTIATVDTGSGPAADLHVLFSDDGNTNTDVV